MDALERLTPRPGDTNIPPMRSCCSTATFPPDVVHSWMRDWRIVAAAGLAVAGSGVALGWDWLTAIGIAPLIVSAAPCLLMCALGLCMMGRGHQANSGSAGTAPADPANPTDRE